MEHDQIEVARNRRVYNAGTIAAHESMFEERRHHATGFPAKKQTVVAFLLICAAEALHFCGVQEGNSDMDFHAV